MIAARVACRLVLASSLGAALMAQTAPARKKLLVIGEEKGYRHEAVTHAMVTIDRLGRESAAWDTVIRTDTEALTKGRDVPRDAVVEAVIRAHRRDLSVEDVFAGELARVNEA